MGAPHGNKNAAGHHKRTGKYSSGSLYKGFESARLRESRSKFENDWKNMIARSKARRSARVSFTFRDKAYVAEKARIKKIYGF